MKGPIPAKGTAGGDPSAGCFGAALVAGIIFLFVATRGCSNGNDSSPQAAANLMSSNISAAVAAQPARTVEPVDVAAAARGFAHLRLAMRAEGFPGAMIYSQNCYDALSRTFSWSGLDRCGGFDMLTARAADDADLSSFPAESGYFAGEAAAGRYLAAATGAGEETGEADARLETLRKRAAGSPVPLPPAPALQVTAAEPEVDRTAPENDNSAAEAD